MFLITELRRKRLRSQPVPEAWRALVSWIPLCLRLPEQDRQALYGHIQVFLAEKMFEGSGGLAITDEIRVTIAAQACILILKRPPDYFPGLSSIIVYPGEYLAPHVEVDDWGVVTEGTDQRSGESTRDGALVLSWEDILAEEIDVHPGYNVVLHEFAHELDAEEGITSGNVLREELHRELERLRNAAAHGHPTVLDPYGAEGPEELFAVATEAFFETPHPFREHHPAFYGKLVRLYRQDPAEWPPAQPSRTSY